MVEAIKTNIQGASKSLGDGLDKLIHCNSDVYKPLVCITCDKLLEYGEEKSIKRERLEKLREKLSGTEGIRGVLPRKVKHYYTYNGSGSNNLIKSMLLSPNAIYIPKDDAFRCCDTCASCLATEQYPSRVRVPQFSMCNGVGFGKPPKELMLLNEVELCLISKARIDKHVFALFGGAHKQMTGWHNMYENNTSHIGSVMHQLKDFGIRTTIACILMGPFTPQQKARAYTEIEVRPHMVLDALMWLKKNNRHYEDYKIPNIADIPEPIIIDKSEIVASENSDIERKFEFTVTFPETDNITPMNGGCMTKDEFRKVVLDSLDTTTNITMLCPPSKRRIRDYDDTALQLAFPLQFPYGCGGLVSPNRTVPAGTRMEYIKFLLRSSMRAMHKPAFILVLHCMFERHRALTLSYLKCNNNMGNESVAEAYSNIKLSTLKAAINQSESDQPIRNPVARRFLYDLEAVCKGMGHTNETARKARLHMFASVLRFGPPTLFLTVTPEDSESFRIEVYACGESRAPPKPNADIKAVNDNVTTGRELRQNYPGLCAFDFDQLTRLIIDHVLGWDSKNQCSKPQGGAFGKLNAWCAAVEEQGRKTLHHHWILWVDGWSDIVDGMHSSNVCVQTKAQRCLEKYVDEITESELFGGAARGTTYHPYKEKLMNQTWHHHCISSRTVDTMENDTATVPFKIPVPIPCSDQDLRNLRCAGVHTELGRRMIAECPRCQKGFSSEELKQKLVCLILDEDGWENRLRLAVKRYGARFDIPKNEEEEIRRNILVCAKRNLHQEDHKSTCFKKGNECRSNLPTRPSMCTKTHSAGSGTMKWYSWRGTETLRVPYIVVKRRDNLDVFVNAHSRFLSNLLGCNTNIQCGIDGAHVIYITMYTSKGNQQDDSRAYIKVAAALYDRLRKQEEEARRKQEENSDDGDVPMEDMEEEISPFSEGYRRLLSAVFAHTKAHVTSAPMAWYITQYGGRFLFSHDSTYVPLNAYMGEKSYQKVTVVGKSLYVVNKMAEYECRPVELENVSLYDFFMYYEIVKETDENSNDLMSFTDDFVLSETHGVRRRKHWVVPLASYNDFPSAAQFEGDILDPRSYPSAAMEKFAKTAITLFVPFRQRKTGNYITYFRDLVSSGKISKQTLQYLQNIQDVRNMLSAGRQPDELEQLTMAPVGDTQIDDEGNRNTDLDKYIEECMTNIMSAPVEGDTEKFSTDEHGFPEISVTKLAHEEWRAEEEDYVLKTKDFVENNYHLVQLKHNSDNVMNDRNETYVSNQNAAPVTFERLAHLLCVAIRRKTDNRVLSIVPNGTAKSIDAWADIAFRDKHGRVDKEQKRAFEVIVSKFVLTYFDEVKQKEKLKDELYAKFGVTNDSEQPQKKRRVGTRNVDDTVYAAEQLKLERLSGTREEQLIMFLTGAGGSGKSRVISQVMSYGHGFCKRLGVVFNKRTIVVTALTGVAATMIDGETVDSACHLLKKSIGPTHVNEWKDARLVIVDEVSFAGKNTIVNLHHRLCQLKEVRQHGNKFGNMHIVFSGDFSQLEPVGALPLYCETKFAMWHDWINCFVELKGQHRYSQDKKYGGIMKRFREGVPTDADFELINSRVVPRNERRRKGRLYGRRELAYAVYKNKSRSRVNNLVFLEHLKNTHSKDPKVSPPQHTLIVKSDELRWSTNNKEFNEAAKYRLWGRCTDSHIKTACNRPKFVDPFLKLYGGIPLMYVENDSVEDKKANGTLLTLKRVVMHDFVTESDFNVVNIDGYYVRTVDASKVSHLLCTYNEGGIEKEMVVECEQRTCTIQMPMSLVPGEERRHNTKASINRFPVLVNYCTTGHKLQGQTKECIYIKEWEYSKNWPYVVLSRVKTLNGLFLETPIKTNKKLYKKDNRLINMLNKFRRKRPRETFQM